MQTNLNFVSKKPQQETCAPVKEEILKETKRKHNLDGNSDEFATPAKKSCIVPLVPEGVNSFDIGQFVASGKELDHFQLAVFLQNVWVPPKGYTFPVKHEFGKSRKFLPSWLDDFCWLAYSKFSDGCFCILCVLFSKNIGHSEARIKQLLKLPVSCWTSAREKFKQHCSKSLIHKDSVLMMESFKRRMEDQGKQVHVLASSAFKERIPSNRSKFPQF